MQEQTPYVLIGGEATVASCANRFYELMAYGSPVRHDSRAAPGRPAVIARQAVHVSFRLARRPDLYVQNIGHPMLRRRHMPFAIGEDERDQWVACMLLAMESVGIERSRCARSCCVPSSVRPISCATSRPRQSGRRHGFFSAQQAAAPPVLE
jgi:hemoglobin